jgi:hypothetical protein
MMRWGKRGFWTQTIWRRDPESNWARRICNPLHNRFAIAPSDFLAEYSDRSGLKIPTKKGSS